jgi:hypothetical protein
MQKCYYKIVVSDNGVLFGAHALSVASEPADGRRLVDASIGAAAKRPALRTIVTEV